MQAFTHSRPTQPKLRVLCLGSDLELIAALKKVLAKPDYWLVTCSDRESAILFLKSEIQYDLLLLDLEWRGKEGLKLVRLARSLRHRKRMPKILVATAGLRGQMAALARRSGVIEWVTKSRDMGALGDVVKRVLPSM